MTDSQKSEIKELEDELSYLIHEGMTAQQKLLALSDAYWQVYNAGYADAMANKLMAGEEDSQTEFWEKNCEHKYAIGRLYNLIKENESESKDD